MHFKYILVYLFFTRAAIKYPTTRIPEMLGHFLNLNKMKTKKIQITWANIIFTIEHREHNKYAQNELISNLMPATGLKIVGMFTMV